MQLLTLVANGTMLSFVILHRDLKHVVAANADPMDFQRLLPRIVFSCGFTMLSCMRIAHWRILTRNADITKTSLPLGLQHPKRVNTWPHSGLLRQPQTGLLQFYD
jgi:hypothetical protein